MQALERLYKGLAEPLAGVVRAKLAQYEPSCGATGSSSIPTTCSDSSLSRATLPLRDVANVPLDSAKSERSSRPAPSPAKLPPAELDRVELVPRPGLVCDQCRVRTSIPPCVPKGWSKNRAVPVCGNCQQSHKGCSWSTGRALEHPAKLGPSPPRTQNPKTNPRKRGRISKSPGPAASSSPAATTTSQFPEGAAHPIIAPLVPSFESSECGVRPFEFVLPDGDTDAPWPRLPASLVLFDHPVTEFPLKDVVSAQGYVPLPEPTTSHLASDVVDGLTRGSRPANFEELALCMAQCARGATSELLSVMGSLSGGPADDAVKRAYQYQWFSFHAHEAAAEAAKRQASPAPASLREVPTVDDSTSDSPTRKRFRSEG